MNGLVEVSVEFKAFLEKRFMETLEDPLSALCEEVDVGLQGAVDLVGSSLQISCGAIESSPNRLETTWFQLERTIRMMEFVAMVATDDRHVHSVLVARVYVPARAFHQEQYRPTFTFGISKHLHRV